MSHGFMNNGKRIRKNRFGSANRKYNSVKNAIVINIRAINPNIVILRAKISITLRL
jgi:hypothetical protein